MLRNIQRYERVFGRLADKTKVRMSRSLHEQRAAVVRFECDGAVIGTSLVSMRALEGLRRQIDIVLKLSRQMG